jgi:predicted TIM-barrel fold metal-dependent hydrolase
MNEESAMDRCLVVSSDSHLGPSMQHDLRPYCPAKHLDAFDDYVQAARAALQKSNRFRHHATQVTLDHYDRLSSLDALRDPAPFLDALDDEGIAATLLFAGGGNDEVLPWSVGPGAGDTRIDPELRIVGERIWNEWLADFVAAAPDRLVGVMQQPIWDLDRAIEEIQWGAAHGLRAINFPAPRPDYPTYNDPAYDRFWSAVEDVDLALVCHGGGGALPWYQGPGAYQLFSSEMSWYSRRGFAQMVFGGVFDRHPRLRVGFTEQRGGWIAFELRNLDSCYLDPQREFPDNPEKLPSEYWREHCFVGASFMARFEADARDEIGVETITWGGDFPHVEGTWPNTRLAMRNTFAGIPEPEVRMMLGTNAVRLYGLDATRLQPIADRIGPTPAEIDVPLADGELPEKVGLAFRTLGDWA